jgi:hypothetical protein
MHHVWRYVVCLLFQVVISVQVGAFDESKGQTGIAHFLEHLAFKGSSIVGTTDFKQESLIHAAQDEVFAELLFLRARQHEASFTAGQAVRLASLQQRLNGLIEQGADLCHFACSHNWRVEKILPVIWAYTMSVLLVPREIHETEHP